MGVDVVLQKASTVVSVQAPAGSINATCPTVISTEVDFRCSAVILSGTYLQMSIDWADGIIEQFAVSGMNAI